MVLPQTLLHELIEFVELLAAPSSEQKKWLTANGYPADELAQQFNDVIPGRFYVLNSAGLLKDSALHDLLALKSSLDELLIPTMRAMWTMDGVTDEDDNWRRIRKQARNTLAVIRA